MCQDEFATVWTQHKLNTCNVNVSLTLRCTLRIWRRSWQEVSRYSISAKHMQNLQMTVDWRFNCTFLLHLHLLNIYIYSAYARYKRAFEDLHFAIDSAEHHERVWEVCICLAWFQILKKNILTSIHCDGNWESYICLVQVARVLIRRNIWRVLAAMTVWTARKNISICRVWVLITLISRSSSSVMIENRICLLWAYADFTRSLYLSWWYSWIERLTTLIIVALL